MEGMEGKGRKGRRGKREKQSAAMVRWDGGRNGGWEWRTGRGRGRVEEKGRYGASVQVKTCG